MRPLIKCFCTTEAHTINSTIIATSIATIKIYINKFFLSKNVNAVKAYAASEPSIKHNIEKIKLTNEIFGSHKKKGDLKNIFSKFSKVG